MQSDYEEMDVADWVMLNMEQVQNIRDKAVVKYKEVSGKRKKVLDRKAINIKFAVGDRVYYKVWKINSCMRGKVRIWCAES